MKTAIFLGAGASAAEGAPIQNGLFREYFSSEKLNKQSEIYKELAKFFKAIFNINLTDPLDTITFPTFEEALGVLDLSETRRESFRGFNFAGIAPVGNQGQGNGSQVQLIRLDLIFVMAKAIADGLKRKEREARKEKRQPEFPHRMLVNNLRKQKLLSNTIFISTNYDMLIDEALGWNLDYGVQFAGAHRFGGQGTFGPNAVKVFKIHGSLNWLYCPVCNNLNGYEFKAVLSLMYSDRPVIFCGFCSNVGLVRFTLINHHEKKKKKEADDEKQRYVRYLGRNIIDTRKSFQDFARDPKKFYKGQ